MSHGYNTQFKRDPVAFMSGHWWDINSTGVNGQFQPNYTLNENSVGKFDLFSRRNSTLELRDFSEAGFFQKSIGESAIKAYYLNSRTDNTEQIQVIRHADYFFTDTITGCTFIAYGTSRNAMVCQHINSFTHGSRPLREGDGWHFYARRRINSGGALGQRVIDAAVFEL